MTDVASPTVMLILNSTSTYEHEDTFQLEEASSTILPLNSSSKTIETVFHNDKGYYIDDDDDGLNDLQVLFLACFLTLIPLIVSVVAAFGISKRRKGSSCDGMLDRDGTTESINKPLHSHLLSSDKVSCDTHLDMSTEEVEICDSTVVNTSQVRSNHSSTNGSIITMTLKNNHLIVETEERNDLEADSRETTMRYSPGARDGIFIVEVQQGMRSSPTSTSNASTSNFNIAVNMSNQCAVVHNNADSSSEEAQNEEPDDLGYTEISLPEPIGVGRIKTGLTQSSSSLNNPSYHYTNQQCYDNEGYGYNLYNGYVNDEPLKRTHYNQKLKITSAIYKNPSKSMDLDAPPDGFLLSDIMAASVAASGEDRKVQDGVRKTPSVEGDTKKEIVPSVGAS
ncbi:uncharacterized protein LOC123681735 isoform X2 [Harmonia axyridis]|uniref:uncharacterized protein LOC123681735 isoform X2 n=1 Tax=Harmonia axyridis TaxID=115357 RepID=UPI001E276D8E|nr:uncharacterized protein LOC123681735 isoform X2 [Harmonia axyridis]